MQLTFCSLPCFEAHVPMLRHREAWAEEQRAPSFEAYQAQKIADDLAENEAKQERLAGAALKEQSIAGRAGRDKERPDRVVDSERLGRVDSNWDAGVSARVSSVERQAATATGSKPAASKELTMSNEVTKEVLVVISKVKSYIRAKSGMNTSDAVTEALSELVRSACEQAIEKAKSDGRKTVMARDIAGSSGVSE
jgi:histone H3/H4